MNNSKRILIVDDDKDFQEVLSAKFKASGFEVWTAPDGAEGVTRAKEFKPDLIIMDVKMPKMDGMTAMLKIKEDPETKNIKIILLTAFGDPQPEIYNTDKRFAGEIGADGYLLKTQDLDEIVLKTKELLSN